MMFRLAGLSALAGFTALLAVPASAQTPDWNKGAPLTLTMTNKGFVPARIVMRSGRAYTLRIRNPSTRAHTFSAKAFFAQAGVSPRDQSLVARNEVELKPGASATLHLVAPTTPGALYAYKSTRVADAAMKYKGDIIVR